MNCDEARVAIGALVIGALEADEERQVREHLADCAECRAEYEELSEMPRLLGLVTLADAVPPAVPPAELWDGLVRQTVEERRTIRRRRIGWTVGGGVALAAVAASLGFGLAEAAGAESADEANLPVLAATDPTTGVRGQVQLDGVAWGTRLELELAGVTAGETCTLVAVSSTGQRETTATWTVPDSTPGDKYLTVPGAASLTPDRIGSFEVVTSGGTAVLSLTTADLVGDEQGADALGH